MQILNGTFINEYYVVSSLCSAAALNTLACMVAHIASYGKHRMHANQLKTVSLIIHERISRKSHSISRLSLSNECTYYLFPYIRRFDFTSLSGKKYELRAANQTYVLGICEPPKEPCLENAGVCQTTNGQSASLGIVNGDLMATEKGAPYLLYRSGSACGSIQNQWETKIEFICEDNDGNQNVPKVIENKDCLMVVQFPTKLACDDQVN